MDNFRQTMDYLFKYGKGKRFLILSLFTFVPCAMVAYFFPLSKYIQILFDFRTTSYTNWGKFWLSSFDTRFYALITLAVALLVFVPIFAYLTTIITRHIRIGKFGLPPLFRSINDNFFATLSVTVFAILAIAVFHFIFTLIVFMWMQIGNKTVGLVLAIITLFALIVLVTYCLSATLLWLPTMSFSGLYMIPALGSAFYKSRNYQRYFFVPSLGAVCIAFGLSLICYFVRDLWYVSWIITALIYTTFVVFMITLSLISYCESEAIQREDLTKIYFGR